MELNWQTTLPNTSFESEALECVRTGIALLGDSVSQVIEYNLKSTRGISQDEIPHKPQELEKCLDEIFGSGAAFLKRAIIQQVKTRFGLKEDYSHLRECFEAAASQLGHIAPDRSYISAPNIAFMESKNDYRH
jgi:hypothetical protein